MIRIGRYRILTRKELHWKLDQGFLKGKKQAEDSQRSVKVRPNSKPKSKLGKSETPKGRL